MKKNKIKQVLGVTLVGTLLCQPISLLAMTKEESVYVNVDPFGIVSKTTVTNHLFNQKKGELLDETELKDILNINGKETFTLNDHILKWQANGRDLFYQGTTQKQLPISVSIDYYLNGSKKDLKDMLGKKGTVKMILRFQNHLKKEVVVNGSRQTLYTPFVVTIGTVLDAKTNRNIEVTNGKVVATGSRNMVVSLASPGLYESFGNDSLKGMNEITLSFETDSFSLSNIYIVATPKLLAEKDFDIFHKLDSLGSDMQYLQSSMDTIEKGARQLKSGSETLSSGAKEIAAHLQTVVTSLEALEQGSINLKDGLSRTIHALEQTTSVINQPTKAGSITQLNALKDQNKAAISTYLSSVSMSYDDLQTYYVTNQLDSYHGSDAQILSCKTAYEMVTLLNANNTAIEEMIKAMGNIDTQTKDLLIQLKQTLETLEQGASKLNGGLSTLKAGVSQVYNGADSLVNGTQTLNHGAMTLSNGITTFNQSGIQKLTGYSNLIVNYSRKAEAMIQLSKEYKGFASSNADESTFIYFVKGMKK